MPTGTPACTKQLASLLCNQPAHSCCVRLQVAVSLAEAIVALQEWQLATSLLLLCAEAVAKDPARSMLSAMHSLAQTAVCGAAPQHGTMDGTAAARAAATGRGPNSASDTASVANGARHHGCDAQKHLTPLSGVALAVALLHRMASTLKALPEQPTGLSLLKAALMSVVPHTRSGF